MGIEHETVAAIEFDEKTMKSYNIIHGTNFETQDITKIDVEQFPDVDVIFYSPPCQAFSIAGRQDGFGDPRGTLFFDAFKIIQAKKPKYAVMENVKGLTQKKFQFEFETMLQLLEQEGYRNFWKVLNAKHYGLPQNRERVFIVSIREDAQQQYEFPQPYDSGLKLKDFLEEEVNASFYVSDDKSKILLQDFTSPAEDGGVYPCLTPERIRKRQIGRRFKENGEPSFTVNTQDKHGILCIGNVNPSGKGINGNVFHEDGLCPTITTNKGEGYKIAVSYSRKTGIGKEIDTAYTLNSSDWRGINRNQTQNAVVDFHSMRIRKLTPLECLRLMGFDDEDYHKLKNNKISNSQIYKMAGNSIAVNKIEHILRKLFIHSKQEIYQ